MTVPHASDATLLPLTHDADVLERVSVLLGRAFRRQIWLMFLDGDDRQLPLLMPSDIPPEPAAGDAARLSEFIGELVDTVDARSVIICLERRARDELTDVDRAWLRMMRDAAQLAAVPLRGPLLVHRTGVRWIGAEDLD